MPLYTFRCSKCGLVFDHIECMEHRNNAQVCPGCSGPAGRDEESEISRRNHHQNEDHPRLSHSMGVNPEQIKEAEKNFPGSAYAPDGRLVIKNRQHKLYEMKRRGMEEIGGR